MPGVDTPMIPSQRPHFQQHPHPNAKDAGSGLAAELTSKGLFGMLFRPANNPVVYYN